MPMSLLLFAMLIMGMGMCVGWAWGCAAMAAALQARNQVLLASQEQTAYAGYASLRLRSNRDHWLMEQIQPKCQH
jgi:hypothetical protein